ncbi:Gfo/Idh/MocA family protein [Enorma massiliensis]|uniref:Gfo/Idh/MocA family protein n=1 Tax=Enorma massiliensis TaxID=1472761 RepID=UPI0034A4BCCB
MIRFGILGAGKIAHRFAASLAKVEGAELVAASRRTAEKAAAFLAEVPCTPGARAYGDHEALLADPEVDAIYLALPHDLHHAWALRALDAGKAVLCEKPAMLSEAEAAEVTAAARERGLLFMEAMKTRFVPLHPHVVDAVGALGPVARVHASLCNDALAAYRTCDTYILSGGPGSGVLLDCGIYCASWLDELLPGEIAVERVDTAFYEGSDVYVDARMTIGGVAAELECACDRARPRQLVVEGERGVLTVDDLHRPQHAELRIAGEPTRDLDAPYEVDDFYGQITHFCALMRAGDIESPLMPHAATCRCARILDAIRTTW